MISIAARMVGSHPQTLRMYERLGLVEPQRSASNNRLYSDADLERVRRIQHLTQDMGVNLAGVEVVFRLLAQMEKMREEMEVQQQRMQTELEQRIARLKQEVGRLQGLAGSQTSELQSRERATNARDRE